MENTNHNQYLDLKAKETAKAQEVKRLEMHTYMQYEYISVDGSNKKRKHFVTGFIRWAQPINMQSGEIQIIEELGTFKTVGAAALAAEAYATKQGLFIDQYVQFHAERNRK